LDKIARNECSHHVDIPDDDPQKERNIVGGDDAKVGETG
jgi:hypothetical protein